MEQDDRNELDQEALDLDLLLAERLGPRSFTDDLDDLPWKGRDVDNFEIAVGRLFARLQDSSNGATRSRRRAQPRATAAAASQSSE